MDARALRLLAPLLALLLGAGLWFVFSGSAETPTEYESEVVEQDLVEPAAAEVAEADQADSHNEGREEVETASAIAIPSLDGLLSSVANAVIPDRKIQFNGWVREGELPVPGAVVYAYASTGWGADGELDAFNKDSPFLCNDEGYFEGEFPLDNTVALQARAPGMEPINVFKMRTQVLETVAGVNLQMKSRRELTGFVIDADELPVAGAEVQVRFKDHWNMRYAGPVDHTTYYPREWVAVNSGVGGEFKFSVPDRALLLEARHEEKGRASKSGALAADSPHRLQLEVEEGEPGFIWEGMAYHYDGRPAAHAQISVQPSGVQTTADENGSFRFDSLKEHWAEQTTLLAWAPGSAPGLIELGKIAADEFQLRVDMAAPTTIEGTVVREDGIPIAGVTVLLSGDRALSEWSTPPPTVLSIFTHRVATEIEDFSVELPLNQARTNEEGRFKFEWIPQGDYYLSLGSSIYSPTSAAKARSGDTDVELVEGKFPDDMLNFAGIVRDRNTGEPLPGVGVTIWKANGSGASGIRNITTNAEGRYSASGFMAGEYYVSASGQGYASSQTENVELTEGTSEAELLVFPERKAIIRVVNSAGERLEGVRINIYDVDGANQTIWSGNGSGGSPKPTNAAGEVIAHRMPGCKVTIKLSGPYTPGQERLEMTHEADWSLDIEHVVEIVFDPEQAD